MVADIDKLNWMIIYYKIMIADIDKLNQNLMKNNILQLKWILQVLILKNNYKLILEIQNKFYMCIFAVLKFKRH